MTIKKRIFKHYGEDELAARKCIEIVNPVIQSVILEVMKTVEQYETDLHNDARPGKMQDDSREACIQRVFGEYLKNV